MKRFLNSNIITFTVVLFLLVSLANLWLANTRFEYEIHQQLEVKALKERLVRLKHQDPINLIKNEGHWINYNSLSAQLLLSLQLAKYGNETLPPWNPKDEAGVLIPLIEDIVKEQAKIKSHRNDFMKLVSQHERLNFRLSRLTDSCDLIISSIHPSQDKIRFLPLLYELKALVNDTKFAHKNYWLAIHERQQHLKNTLDLTNDIEIQSTLLIDEKNGLRSTAQRRTILNMTRDISQLKEQMEDLKNADRLVTKITNIQQHITSIANQALDAIKQLDYNNNTAFISATLQLSSIVLLLMLLLSKNKNVNLSNTPSSQGPTTIKKTATRTSSQSSASESISDSNQFDFDSLLTAMEQAAKGNLRSRADERNANTREVARLYNSIVAKIYRQIVAIYQETQLAKQAIDNLNLTVGTNNGVQLESMADLDAWIENTLEIAGILDQLERCTSNDKRNMLIQSLDTKQALLRAKIRDLRSLIAELPLEESNHQEPHTNNSQQVLAAHISNIEQTLKFFQLDRRT